MSAKRYAISLLALAITLIASASQIKLSLQPASPAAGETFYLLISTSDVQAEPQPVSSFPGAKVLYPLQVRSAQTQTVSMNGVTRTSMTATYAVTMRAETPGNYSFGPIRIGNVASNKITYNIRKGSAAQQPAATPDPNAQPKLQSGGNGKLFLRATVSNANPYEQQGVEYVVRLYTSYTSIFDWTAPSSPKFGNCTYEASDAVSRSLTLADYQGRAYESAIIARYIIYPTQTGIAKITGNTYTGSVAERYTYSDPYFGSMSRVQPKQVSATPNEIQLNVKPLPPHDGVLSGVGTFNVSSQLVSKQFKAHQAATIRYTISGTGNLGYLSLPDMNEVLPAEIKFIKSEDAVKKQVGTSSVSGTMTFDCTVIPQRAGKYKIPEVKFLFFNPEKGTYYTVSAQGYEIEVAEGSNASSSDDSLTFNDNLQQIGKLQKAHTFLLSRSGVWLWYICPAAILALLMYVYRKRMAGLADVTGTKKRKAGKIAKMRLRAAAAALKQNNSELFYQEMLKALWGYLSNKLSINTSELTRDNVSDKLSEANVSAQSIDRIIKLIDECEFAKYAPDSDSNMNYAYDEATQIIDRVESEIGKTK